MRFKNYINRYNKKNRIYSMEELLSMTLNDLLDNELSIMSQDSDIGIPTYEELKNSPNTRWIDTFTNEQGQTDGGFYGSINDNYYNSIYKREKPFIIQENPIKPYPVYMSEQEENAEEEPIVLNGGVEENVYHTNNPFVPDALQKREKNTLDKYFGLGIGAATQKAASKILPYNDVENEYYRNSLKMKDNEPLTDKFLEENDVYMLKDITDPIKSKYYKEQLAQMYGIDVKDPDIDEKLKDKKIVIPKETSRLYQYAKNLEAMEKWIVDNYDRIKNGEKPLEDFFEFPMNWKEVFDVAKRGLYTTIHNANMRDLKVNSDGSITGRIDDPYNYEKWQLKHYKDTEGVENKVKTFVHNMVARINNNAYEQQQGGQLEDLYLSMPFSMTEEEIKKLKKKYGRL